MERNEDVFVVFFVVVVLTQSQGRNKESKRRKRTILFKEIQCSRTESEFTKKKMSKPKIGFRKKEEMRKKISF